MSYVAIVDMKAVDGVKSFYYIGIDSQTLDRATIEAQRKACTFSMKLQVELGKAKCMNDAEPYGMVHSVMLVQKMAEGMGSVIRRFYPRSYEWVDGCEADDRLASCADLDYLVEA